MRWSFLHCLFVALLTSVVFDGVVARPIPNDLYRRTPTGGSPSPPHTPAPHTPGKQPQSPSHQTPSKIPVAVKSHGSSNLSPSHQTPSKLPVAVKSHNLRPRPPKAPLTVAQGKKAAPPPSKIPRPVTNKKDTAAGLKAWNYRDKAIRQGKIYDPKKQQVVQGKPTAKQLGHSDADHIVEAQTVHHALAHLNLDTPHKEQVKAAVNSPSNLALVHSNINQKKGQITTKALAGKSVDPTPRTERYMKAVAGQSKTVAAKIDAAAGGGSSVQDAQEKVAKKSGTK